MHKRIVAAGAGLVALLALGCAVLPAAGQDASSSAATAAPMSNADILADGKHIWSDAACSNCHGANAGGGHSADFPAGPSLRTSGLDPQTMLQMVECGIPGTKMPSWLKGAYTETACYGNPLGPAPGDVLTSGAYTEQQLRDLVAYVQTNFMKAPMPDWTAAAH